MNRERLIELERFLRVDVPAIIKESLGKFEFDMYNWHHELWCRTRACALGWAAMHQPFNDEGLRVDRSRFYLNNNQVGAERAGSDFFDLSVEQFDFLFIPNDDEKTNDTSKVCERILYLLAHDGEVPEGWCREEEDCDYDYCDYGYEDDWGEEDVELDPDLPANS